MIRVVHYTEVDMYIRLEKAKGNELISMVKIGSNHYELKFEANESGTI